MDLQSQEKLQPFTYLRLSMYQYYLGSVRATPPPITETPPLLDRHPHMMYQAYSGQCSHMISKFCWVCQLYIQIQHLIKLFKQGVYYSFNLTKNTIFINQSQASIQNSNIISSHPLTTMLPCHSQLAGCVVVAQLPLPYLFPCSHHQLVCCSHCWCSYHPC